MSAAPFFQLSASYVIAPGASVEDLLNDCNCLLSSAIGGIEADSGGDGFTQAQWAGLYALRQGKAVFDEIAQRVFAAQRIERHKGGAA